MEPAIQSSVTPCRLVAGLTARTIERTVGVVAIVTGIVLGAPLILSCIIRAVMIFDGARDTAGRVSTLSVVADLGRSAVGGVGYVLMIAVGVRLVHQRESVRRLLGAWAAVAIGAVLLGVVVGAIEEARTLAAGWTADGPIGRSVWIIAVDTGARVVRGCIWPGAAIYVLMASRERA